jgi:hypothetical protein
MGEADLAFKFLPAGGQFHLRGSDEALTAYGGLVASDHFLERCGVFAELARCYPLPRTSPNATPVADILKAFSLNCLVGGTRFAHCRRLQDDAAVARITGMHKGRLCGEDAFRRLCESLDNSQVEAWFAPAEQMIHHAMPPNCVADWDSTVVPRYGKQEDAAIGYNPQKPGRPSHHPLACVTGGTRLCLHMEWRKGNTVSASGWIEAIKSRYELLLIPAKLVLSGRRKIVKLAVGSKFASFLKQAHQRLEEWLSRTAPQLSLCMNTPPPWQLFDPTQTTSSAVT